MFVEEKPISFDWTLGRMWILLKFTIKQNDIGALSIF